jgi:hypothetical protein
MKEFIPQEVQDLTDRLKFLSCGTKQLEELFDFDYIKTAIKIKYLLNDPVYKDSVRIFLTDTALPIIEETYEIFSQIIAGISFKKSYNNSSELDKTTDEDLGYASDRLREELNYYLFHFKLKVDIVPESRLESIPITKNNKIKTNLSIEELAALLRILKEYDKGENGNKKILKDSETNTGLFNDVVDSISSIQMNNIKASTLSNRYYSTELIKDVDFWIEKFGELKKGATRLRVNLVNSPDKSKNKNK